MITYDVELVDLQPQDVAVVKADVSVAEIPTFLAGAFDEVLRVLAAAGLAPAGPPFCRYASFGPTFSVEAGFPATGVVVPAGRVVPGVLPGGTVARVLHIGDYAAVGSAYESATAWLGSNGYELHGPPWESYLDDPTVAHPRTLVSLPCRRVVRVGQR